MRKLWLLLWMMLIGSNLILSVSALETGNYAQWEVISDDLEVFNYYEQYDWIRIEIVNGNEYSMTSNCSWYMLDTDWIIWEDGICFPFFIDPTLLQNPLTTTEDYTYEINIIDYQTATIFGVERQITTVRMEKLMFDQSLQVYHYLEYDYESGLLLRWEIRNQNQIDPAFTLFELTDTTVWVFTNQWETWEWFLFGIGLVSITGFSIFFGMKLLKKS